MRPLFMVLSAVSTLLTGCHEPQGNGDDGGPPSDGAGAVSSDWASDTGIGIACRLVQPDGAIAIGEEGRVRVEYNLTNPDRFGAVEAELGEGLARVAGVLRETDPAADQTLEVRLQPREDGEYLVHAYVVWNDGAQESCGAFDLEIAQG